MTSPHRIPYVGAGADGARRSARIDQEEADTLPAGDQRDAVLLSAERWNMQAEAIEAGLDTRVCGAVHGNMSCDLPDGHSGSHQKGNPRDGLTTWTRGLGSRPLSEQNLLVVRNLRSDRTHVMDVRCTSRASFLGRSYDEPMSGRAACGVRITDGVVMQAGSKVRCAACAESTGVTVQPDVVTANPQDEGEAG